MIQFMLANHSITTCYPPNQHTQTHSHPYVDGAGFSGLGGASSLQSHHKS